MAWSWFCGHCVAPPPHCIPAPHQRLCASCGVGLVQQARADLAPTPGDAFLIVDSTLRVQAVSEAAQALLTVSEEQAVGYQVTELLLPADVEAVGASVLAEAITRAAGADDARATAFVRPGMTFGLRLRARIVACGPPRAALIAFQ